MGERLSAVVLEKGAKAKWLVGEMPFGSDSRDEGRRLQPRRLRVPYTIAENRRLR